nr:MAG TPA: hypothetical protein [Caudoviricetes sp.]
MLSEGLNWLCEKAVELLSGGLVSICGALAAQSEVFVIGALIGAFFIMFGKKATGTKITSTSIFLYIILKVVGTC